LEKFEQVFFVPAFRVFVFTMPSNYQTFFTSQRKRFKSEDA
jgi:hypothetical protein